MVSVAMSVPVSEGDVLAGKYRVEKVLGVGGMGVVVAAHHLQLDERVALKFLLPEVLSSAEAVGRFEREARAAVKIKSEHVARVSDVGKLENGAPYMVMEYLDGTDLSGWVEDRGALPVEQAVEFVLQACEAIAEAHSLGIVHRDLKPANLFCTRRPGGELSIKVLDFGISKLTSLSSSGGPDLGLTKTQAMMGSPLYMSPEQMQSAKQTDPRSDIWALGVILYELVTGQVPFTGEALPELVLNVVSMPPRPLRDLRPDAPEGLEPVILRCLEKRPDQRFQNIAELALALAPYGPKRARRSVERITEVLRSSGLTVADVDLPPSVRPGAGTVGSWAQTQGGGSKRSVAIGASIVGVAAVVGGAALFFTRANSAAEPAAAASLESARAEPPGAGLPPPPVAALPEPPAPSATSAIAPAPEEPRPDTSAAHATATKAPVRDLRAPTTTKTTSVKSTSAAQSPPADKPATPQPRYNPADHL